MRAPVRYARWFGALAVLSASGPAFAQLANPQDDGVSFGRVVGALLLCLGLAVAGALAIRARLGGGLALTLPGKSPRRLRLHESLRVSPQVQLAIVACDGREMLISTSASGAQLITHLPPEIRQ
ncbi:MAG TPA: hypothetical protein VKQ27_09120 [Acetobacteraceae bacterium]|nr:hypothetical protein [Acetobacteraceae bacterium]